MKTFHPFLLSLVVVCLTASYLPAAENPYQAAQDQIRQGDLKTALATMKQAVDAAPKNKQYAQEFLLLRQMIATDQQLARETNIARWRAFAQRLRTYLEQKQANPLLLELDRKIYAKTPTADSAAMLAESLIATGNAKEASQLLAGLPEASQNAMTKIVLALAMQHDGKTEEAKQVAAVYSTPQTRELLPTPTLLRLARLEAAVGDADAAKTSLKRLFEQTPPSGQATLRDRCKASVEFAGLAQDAGFEAVLNTASKVAESACSGGSSCGTCPMRSQCQQ